MTSIRKTSAPLHIAATIGVSLLAGMLAVSIKQKRTLEKLCWKTAKDPAPFNYYDPYMD